MFFSLYTWDWVSILGLFSFTISMLIVAYDIQSYVVSFISMAIPFIPTSMLTITLPFLVDFGLYTPEQSYLAMLNSYIISGYNYTLYYTSYTFNIFYTNIINPMYYCVYYMFATPFYIIYYPYIIISTTITTLTKLVFWLFGSLTFALGIKMWVLWDSIINEANTLIVNLNLTNNPIPAYAMAILYQIIIRPGQLIMSTGSQYFIEYFTSILPTIQECYDLLTLIMSSRTMMWNYWLIFGNYIAYLSIFPIAIAGTMIDPVQIFLWFHFTILDHGLLRPALFIGTGVFTGIGRILGIFS